MGKWELMTILHSFSSPFKISMEANTKSNKKYRKNNTK